MTLKTIVLATALAVTSSIAFAQPAPIGSSADFGNGAVLNRGPVERPVRIWIFEPIDHRRHDCRTIGMHAS
jgi:hypothetical protein